MNPDWLSGFPGPTGMLGAADAHDVTTGVAIVIGALVLYVVIKTGKFLLKLFFFLCAAALFAAAYWWHLHR